MTRVADDFPSRISSWADLSYLIEHFSFFNSNDWLFRGIDNASHRLIPKIGRLEARALKKDPNTGEKKRVPYRLGDEEAILDMFEHQARAYLNSPLGNRLELMAVAQHHGLPTRLLDWTDSLLVATWFAVRNGGKEPDSAIWVTKNVPALKIDTEIDPFKLSVPYIYRPPHISPRISAQGSVLMICSKPEEHAVLSFSRQIIIDHSVHFTIKKRLNACGINMRHLFPGLDGLADYLRWMYKHNWLAGYANGSCSNDIADDSLDDVTD